MNANNMGRPETHGLDVIKGDRVRKARFALCQGTTRIDVAEKIFKVSPKTLRRYMHKDDIRSRVLKRAIEEGEALRNEPLGSLICYLLDKCDEIQAQLSEYRYQLPKEESDICLDSLKIKEEDEDEYIRLSNLAKRYQERLEQAYSDNAEVAEYQRMALRVRGAKRIIGLDQIQQAQIENQDDALSMIERAYVDIGSSQIDD